MNNTIGAVDVNMNSLYVGCRLKILDFDGVFTMKERNKGLILDNGVETYSIFEFVDEDNQDYRLNFIIDIFTLEDIQLSPSTIESILEGELVDDAILREAYVHYNAFSVINVWELYAKANNWCEKTHGRRSLSQDWRIGFREIEAFKSLLSS